VPRVVVGVPMYRSEHLVAEALDSLLAQSYEDFAIVAIDDCSPDATYDVVRAHVGRDSRVTVEANGRRLGNCGNSNRVLARALELHPDCELFAWASDNDLREPTWLSAAVKALDEDPAAVLAYSRGGKVVDGVCVPPRAERMSTGPQAARGVDRMAATLSGQRDDAMIYGLQRVHTLLRVGAKPRVVAPDVLFLSHLALYGTFVRLPDGLWYRGTRRTGRSPRRQRATVFGTPPPLWSWLPVQFQRAGWLTRELVIGNRRPPGVGRVGAVTLVGRFCLEDMRQEIAERLKRLKRHGNRTVRQLRKQRTRHAKTLRRHRVRVARAVRRRLRARSS
jgi:glycosyltransferase involved in cell wall biosynthesis